jgi:hypothetical protein
MRDGELVDLNIERVNLFLDDESNVCLKSNIYPVLKRWRQSFDESLLARQFLVCVFFSFVHSCIPPACP